MEPDGKKKSAPRPVVGLSHNFPPMPGGAGGWSISTGEIGPPGPVDTGECSECGRTDSHAHSHGWPRRWLFRG